MIWDVSTGKQLHRWIHNGWVLSVAWSPGGQWVASAGSDQIINIWDVVSGTIFKKWIAHLSAISSLMWSPTGYQLASGSWDESIKIWDVSSATALKTFTDLCS